MTAHLVRGNYVSLSGGAFHPTPPAGTAIGDQLLMDVLLFKPAVPSGSDAIAISTSGWANIGGTGPGFARGERGQAWKYCEAADLAGVTITPGPAWSAFTTDARAAIHAIPGGQGIAGYQASSFTGTGTPTAPTVTGAASALGLLFAWTSYSSGAGVTNWNGWTSVGSITIQPFEYPATTSFPFSMPDFDSSGSPNIKVFNCIAVVNVPESLRGLTRGRVLGAGAGLVMSTNRR